MDDIRELMLKMQTVCPVGCTTSISMNSEDKSTIILKWEMKIKGRRFYTESAYPDYDFGEYNIETMLKSKKQRIRAGIEKSMKEDSGK